jgi:SAM-dependent methyltransferase
MPHSLVQALMNVVPSGKKTVLHVGCGPAESRRLHRSFLEDDWRELRLDADPAVDPDIVAPVTDMRMVADASVDAVWSHLALADLPPQQMPQALAEFRRVLDEGGFALLALAEPNIAATRLRSALLDAGFAHVETWETASELWARAHKSGLAAGATG